MRKGKRVSSVASVAPRTWRGGQQCGPAWPIRRMPQTLTGKEATEDAGERSVILITCPMGQGTSRREPLILPSGIHEGCIKKMAFQLNLKEKIFLRKSDLSNLCWKALVIWTLFLLQKSRICGSENMRKLQKLRLGYSNESRMTKILHLSYLEELGVDLEKYNLVVIEFQQLQNTIAEYPLIGKRK